MNCNTTHYRANSSSVPGDPTNRLGAPIHDYFFLKTLDLVRPGGLVMFITSTGTMDKGESTIREELAKSADLVAVMRFPEATFQKSAGTAVVTDLIILRKRLPGDTRDPRLGDEKTNGIAWAELGTLPDPDGGKAIPINQYFVKRPNQILGRLDRQSRLYGSGHPHVTRTDDFEDLFKRAIAKLPENIWQPAPKPKFEPKRLGADITKTKEGAYEVKDGTLYVREGDHLVERRADEKTITRIRRMIGVRDALHRVFKSQLDGDSPTQTDQHRAELNKVYDSFVRLHGHLHEPSNVKAFADDPDSPTLLALENDWDPKKKTAKKADVFTKNTIRIYNRPERVARASEALGISLNDTGRVELPTIAELLEIEPEEAGRKLVKEGLAYNDPKQGWTVADLYLSGNVRRKLLEARDAAAADDRYAPNVTALEKVQPADIDPTEIDVRLGAPWIPPKDVAAFMAHLMGGDVNDFKVGYVVSQGKWLVDYSARGKNIHRYSKKATEVWGTPRAEFMDIMDAALSDKPVMVYDTHADKTRTFNSTESAAANVKVKEVKDAFKDWIFDDDARRERLARHYNDNFNNIRIIEYDAKHYRDDQGKYVLPGMNPAINLRPHQANAVWQAVSTGTALYAHEVGTGKTFTMVAAAMEMRRLGLAKKPAIAVPKAIIEQFVLEARTLYPGARMITTSGRFDQSERRKTTSQIATGDWDLVIMTHDNMNMLPMRPEIVKEFIGREVQDLEAAIRDAKEEDKSKGNRLVKQLEKQKAKLEARLKEAIEDTKTDANVFFEETGIDFLFVDEAHKYKSLPVYTGRQRIKGIPTTRSDRATNMFMRARWLQRENNGRGVVFATGTPVSNTMVELYNMQRYLQFQDLDERGIAAFDAWVNTFAETTTKMEYSVTGDFTPVTRLAKYTNMPELLQLTRSVMDVRRVDKDMPGTVLRPKKEEEVVSVPMSESQREYLEDIRRRAHAIKQRKGPPRKGEDNMLALSSDARKSALDTRLVEPRRGDDESKVKAVAERILQIHQEKPTVTQMVFSDIGIHKNDWGFSVYQELIDLLVEGGIPRQRIIDFANLTDKQKEKAVERLKSGDALIGIGSTDKLGTGVNAQDHLYALHHMDVPWLPASVEQRDGRGWRQGNQNPTIKIYRYVTTGSFDTFMWQLVDAKSRFIKQAMVGDLKTRVYKDEDGEELSPAKIMAIASGNPDLLVKVNLDEEVADLERQRRSHEQQQFRVRRDLPRFEEKIEEAQADVTKEQKDADLVEQRKGEKFTIEIGGKNYDDRDEAGEALLAAAEQVRLTGTTKIGEYRGFDVIAKSRRQGVLRGPSGNEYPFSFHVADKNEERPVEASPERTIGDLIYALRRPAQWLATSERRLRDLQADLAAIESQIGKPFKHEQELTEKKQRLEEVIKRLSPQEKKDISETEETPVSQRYYIKMEGEWKEVPGEAVVIPGFEEMDFFTHSSAPGGGKATQWTVSEGSTGLAAVTKQKSREEAIRAATETLQKTGLEKVKEAINRERERQGISPRYQAQQGQEPEATGTDGELYHRWGTAPLTEHTTPTELRRLMRSHYQPPTDRVSMGLVFGNRHATGFLAEISERTTGKATTVADRDIPIETARTIVQTIYLQRLMDGRKYSQEERDNLEALEDNLTLAIDQAEADGALSIQYVDNDDVRKDVDVARTIIHEAGIHRWQRLVGRGSARLVTAAWAEHDPDYPKHLAGLLRERYTDGPRDAAVETIAFVLSGEWRKVGYTGSGAFRRAQAYVSRYLTEVARRHGAAALDGLTLYDPAFKPVIERIKTDVRRQSQQSSIQTPGLASGDRDEQRRIRPNVRRRDQEGSRASAPAGRRTATETDRSIGTGGGERAGELVRRTSDDEVEHYHRITDALGGDDLKKAARGVKEITVGAIDDIRGLLFPMARGVSARQTAPIIRARAGEMARKYDIAEKKLEQARRVLGALPEMGRRGFVYAIEIGAVDSLPRELQPFARMIRELLDGRRDEVQALGTGKLQSYYENYFPHIWKDPDKAASVFAQYFAKRPFEGSKSFLKQRKIPTIEHGIALGLEPISDNPVDLVLMKLREMDRYLMAHLVLQEMKGRGLLRFVRATKAPPENWRKIDDKISTVHGPINDQGSLTIRGHWYAPEPAAKVLNNYLSPGLRNKHWFRAYLGVSNVLNQFQLGYSFFHFGFTSIDAAISKTALAIDQLVHGEIVDAGKSIVTSPLAPITNILQGVKVYRAWQDPGSMGPEWDAIATAAQEAGARIKMDSFYQTQITKRMKEAFGEGNLVGGALRVPFALTEQLARPLMEFLVPMQKLGVFADLARTELKRMGPHSTRAEIREVMQKAWNSVDNRMGQLVYDNLFWHKAAKDLGMASIRSLGWNLGTFREVGGGAIDFARFATNTGARAFGRGGGGGGRPPRVGRSAPGSPEWLSGHPEFTYRMGYLLAMPIVVGVLGGIINYLFTGERPQELKDYFFPRTGGRDEEGRAERLSLPSYLKDLYHWYERPGRTAANKLHPAFSLATEMLTNKDFYGVEIRNADDPIMRQVLDSAKHVAGAFEPLAVRGLLQERERGERGIKSALPFIGLTPAPSDLNKTAAEKLMSDLLGERGSGGTKTKEQAALQQIERDLKRRGRSGEPVEKEIERAIEEGQLNGRKARGVFREIDETRLEENFKKLGVEDALKVYGVASAAERKLLLPWLEAKERLLWQMPPGEIRRLEPQLRQALGGK